MSGGVAYVVDTDGLFARRCNTSMVELERLEDTEDIDLVRAMIASHAGHTGSTLAADALSSWPLTCARIVKVIPRDYKRILVAQARARSEKRELAFAELVGVARG
jgi:glutamate synthase (ferredoxin)